MKPNLVGYWICTVLIVFFMLPGGVFYLMRAPAAIHGLEQLGYPLYFAILLGIWKVLGSIALVVPKFPLLKEWAYAGIFFDLTGAAWTNAATHGAWWHVAAPLVIVAILFGSWATRPASRRLVAA